MPRLNVLATDFEELVMDTQGCELWDAYWGLPGTAHEACDNDATFFSGWGSPIIGIENHNDHIHAHLHVLRDSRPGSPGEGKHPHERYHEVEEITMPVSEKDADDKWEHELYEKAIELVLDKYQSVPDPE